MSSSRGEVLRGSLKLMLAAAASMPSVIQKKIKAKKDEMEAEIKQFHVSQEKILASLSFDPSQTLKQITSMQDEIKKFDDALQVKQKKLAELNKKLIQHEEKKNKVQSLQKENEEKLKSSIAQESSRNKECIGLWKSSVDWEKICFAALSAHDHEKAQNLLKVLSDPGNVLFHLLKSSDQPEALPLFFDVKNKLLKSKKYLAEIKEEACPIVASVVWKGKHNDVVIPMLVGWGMDVNAATSGSGSTALHYAVKLGSSNDILTLCTHFADPRIKDKNNVRPIDLCSNESKSVESKKFLTKYEAFFKIDDKEKRESGITKFLATYQADKQKNCVIC